MATSDNVLQITSKGLQDTCKELINKRTFDKNKIEIIGNPKITNGVASLLSENDYFTFSNLSFSNYEKNSIEFSGNYTANDLNYQTAWNLSESSTPSNNISLRVFKDSINLYKGNSELLNISNIDIKDGDFINISTTFDSKKVTLFTIIGTSVYSISSTFSTIINLEDFDSISIGNNNPGNLRFWNGSINLPSFGILKNDVLYYSPSFKNNLSFTKILIGDGVYPLQDNSVPIINHIYEFPLLEVRRSGSNILLTAQIGSTAYLNIKELGLYISSEEGTRLFSLVDNLAIKKGSDLGYSLIFNVNLDVNVVNTNLFPEIILPDDNFSNFENFNVIRLAHTNLIIDMERIIKKNSEELGRNLVQQLYRQKRNLDLLKDNWNAVDSCNKICNRFVYKEIKTFSPNSIVKEGEVEVTDEGVASLFSTTSYIKLNSFGSSFNSFEINIPFTTSNDISQEQCIFESSDGGEFAAFKVYINNQKCYVEGSEKRKIITEGNEYFKNTYKNKILEDTTYYAWTNEDTVVYSLSKLPEIGDSLYSIDPDTETPEELTETVQNLTQNIIFSIPINIKTSTNYILKTTFDGNIYKFYMSENSSEFIKVSDFIINKEIATGENCYFGIDSNLSNPFLGSINLMNYSIITSEGTYCCYSTQVINTILNEFVHIPKTFMNYFKAVDLKDRSRYFEVLDGNITGNEDSVDFSKDNTLCLKLDFKDATDKIVFSKKRKDSSLDIPEYYLKIYLENYNLHLEISSSTETIQVIKNYGINKISKLINNPVTIYIVNTGASFKIYLNNELIGEPGFPEAFDLNSENYFITSSYLKDLINFSGSVTEDDIYYLNNILDTNFGDSKFIITSDGTFEAKFYNTNETKLQNTIVYYVWECENSNYEYSRILLLDKEPNTLSLIYNMNFELIPNLHVISF